LEINFRFLNFKVRVNIVLVGGECRSKRSERDGVASFTDCLSVSSIQDVKTRGRLPPTAPAFLEINFRFLNFKVRVNIVLVGGECRSKRSERDGLFERMRNTRC